MDTKIQYIYLGPLTILTLNQKVEEYPYLLNSTYNLSTEPRKTAINLDLMYDVVKTMPDEGGGSSKTALES